ncbi:U-box domain-containing protein 44 [Platanthera guangdongensis]|uniref:RING-type E3 ubiquitin transferase n=1 Tax=Platanthera guangdongensis TaxID=2320717 RepID=A0ABR2N3B0_9ASPA
MEFLTNARDDVLKRTVDGFSKLVAAADTIKHEEESFKRFLDLMIHVRENLLQRQSHEETVDRTEFTRTYVSVLQKLETEANKARETIDGYRSKSPWLLPFSPSLMYSLNRSFQAISRLFQLLPLANINFALKINSKADSMINGMGSIGRNLEVSNNAILSKIDLLITGKTGIQQYPMRAKNSASSRSVVYPYPIHIEDDETFEVPQGESEGEMAPNDAGGIKAALPLPPSSTADDITVPRSTVFLCPLTRGILQDPVSVICDHSFERTAIEDYFHAGNNSCPSCGKELSLNGKLELISNSALLGSIVEWRQQNDLITADRNAKIEFLDVAAKVTTNDLESTNEALDQLQALMKERPSCISVATGNSCNLVPKIADLLNTPSAKAPALFTCFLLIAGFSAENKERIGKRGVIKRLLEESMREMNAVAVLLELSKSRIVAQKIAGIRCAIPILISLLDNPSSVVQEMARAILENLSIDNDSTVQMAKLGYFTLFLERFNSREISEETRTSMAEELALMQLMEADAKNFENDGFISLLTDMLSCESSSSKMSSLKCIQQLIAFDGPRSCSLRNESFIPALFSLITSNSAAQSLKQEALDIVISLIALTLPPEFETNPGFRTLFSLNCVQDMLEKIRGSAIDDQLALLHLLLVMAQKSDAARRWIVSDRNSFSCLFSIINLDKIGSVKLSALKLIHCVAAVHPIDASLPPSFVRSIITILDEICSDEELSAVAGIVSHLPPGDESINEILQSQAALKSIHSLISRASKSHGLLENALGALLRALNQSTSQFQKQIGKLVVQADLVQILSAGSSAGSPLAKQRVAMILAHLSSCTVEPSLASSSSSRARRFTNMKWKERETCSVHGSGCSIQRAICLGRDGAVKPLVEMVRMTESGAPEAAFMALDTLFDAGCDLDAAAGTIVESGGAAPILDALEKGATPVREMALDLFSMIRESPGVQETELGRFRGLLLNIVRKEEGLLKQKAGKLLKYLA